MKVHALSRSDGRTLPNIGDAIGNQEDGQ